MCEGPECPGPALALQAMTSSQALKSASTAVARMRSPMACATGSSDVEASDDDVDLTDDESIRAAIESSLQKGNGNTQRTLDRLRLLAEALEPLCDVDRIGTSPLVDGYWDLVYASAPPRWWGRTKQVRHAIESAAPQAVLDGPANGTSYQTTVSAGAPGLRTGPRGGEWQDVASGRGAYVQRCRRNPFITNEVRATYTWLGGESWDLSFVSKKWLLFGCIPVWRSRGDSFGMSYDLDYGLRPTYVDGDYLILRTPAVTAGDDFCLRGDRVYMLQRVRNRLWQDNEFMGLSDRWEARWEPQ